MENAVTIFINSLLYHVPELNEIYREHLSDYGEILSHVFLGDVTRYFVQEIRSGAIGPLQPAKRMMAVIDEFMGQKDPDVRELILASFIENLADERDVLLATKRLAGPALSVELRDVRDDN